MSLYIVSTPIGNLKDITLRALEVLKTVDIVAAEDTRQTLKLLSAHHIGKKVVSCHAFNEASSAQELIRALSQGRTIAYCTDAGTPGLSDPGAILVCQARTAGYPVVPIPGPSALTTLLSVSGMKGRTVIFDGFLSPKENKRRKRLEELLARGESFILYESPFRMIKLLQAITDIQPTRELVIGREMTKKFEEFLFGSAIMLLKELKVRPMIKGEFSVFVSGATSDEKV